MRNPGNEPSAEELARCIDLCDRVRERYNIFRTWFENVQYAGIPNEEVQAPQAGFFPPVTQTQLVTAEERIGFRLPTLMRLLYTTVANGCFEPGIPGEPGWGTFLGIKGGYHLGYPFIERPEDRWPIEHYVTHSEWRLEPDTERQLIDNHQSYVVCLEGLPDGFMDFCDAGCGDMYLLDLHSGHIYLSECSIGSFVDPDDPSAANEWTIRHAYSSLEELVERWLSEDYRIPNYDFRQESTCLGFYGAHGRTQATFNSNEEDEGARDRLDDDFFDSADWRWYLQQPPMDTE